MNTSSLLLSPEDSRTTQPHRNLAYPPGSPKIHKWRIKPGVAIPVDAKNFLDLKPGQKFPYDWLGA